MANALIPAFVIVIVAVIAGLMIVPAMCANTPVSDELTPQDAENLEGVTDVTTTLFSFWPVFALVGVALLLVLCFVRIGR